MFSLPKLLVLILILVVVWYGFKAVGRLSEQRSRKPVDPPNPQPKELEAEDLVKCRVCEAFVAPFGANSCGRPDCPYG